MEPSQFEWTQAADPRSDSLLLRKLAMSYPKLWTTIAVNPGTDQALLQWLYSTGDPEVRKVFAEGRAGGQLPQTGHIPPNSMETGKQRKSGGASRLVVRMTAAVVSFLVVGVGIFLVQTLWKKVPPPYVREIPRSNVVMPELDLDTRVSDGIAIDTDGRIWGMEDTDEDDDKVAIVLRKTSGAEGIRFVKAKSRFAIDENGKLWMLRVDGDDWRMEKVKSKYDNFEAKEFRDIDIKWAIDTDNRLWTYERTEAGIGEMEPVASGSTEFAYFVDYFEIIDTTGAKWKDYGRGKTPIRVEIPEGSQVEWQREFGANLLDGKPLFVPDCPEGDTCVAQPARTKPDVEFERLEGSIGFSKDGKTYLLESAKYADEDEVKLKRKKSLHLKVVPTLSKSSLKHV